METMKSKNAVYELLRRFYRYSKARKEQARQRRHLLEMDERMLKDIGLNRADVCRMVGQRWFWQEPLNRPEDLDLEDRKLKKRCCEEI